VGFATVPVPSVTKLRTPSPDTLTRGFALVVNVSESSRNSGVSEASARGVDWG
jgi:hypothetical protein